MTSYGEGDEIPDACKDQLVAVDERYDSKEHNEYHSGSQ